MFWFGESWQAPVNDPDQQVAIPVGMKCSGHEHMHLSRSAVIEQDDQGVLIPYYGGRIEHGRRVTNLAYHLDCWLHELGADRLVMKEHR